MSKPMNAYTGFAKVYETFMDNIPYEEWTTYIKGLLTEYGVAPGSLLCELGCGTGSMTRLLAKAGYDSVDKLTELTADQLFVDYNIGFPDINQIAMALDKQFGLELTSNATDTSDPKYRRLYSGSPT